MECDFIRLKHKLHKNVLKQKHLKSMFNFKPHSYILKCVSVYICLSLLTYEVQLLGCDQ